jgi:hypothetical protein
LRAGLRGVFPERQAHEPDHDHHDDDAQGDEREARDDERAHHSASFGIGGGAHEAQHLVARQLHLVRVTVHALRLDHGVQHGLIDHDRRARRRLRSVRALREARAGHQQHQGRE